MKKGKKLCVWDVEKNTIQCKERDGSWKNYDLNTKSLSNESRRIKDTKINEMLSLGKECYDSGECKNPIQLSVFELESCPACTEHEPIIKDIKKKFSDASIPLIVETIGARDEIERFKSAGCNGTPCVTVKVGRKKEKKAYEGNRGEISAIAEIMGLPNPLFNEMKGNKPKRFM